MDQVTNPAIKIHYATHTLATGTPFPMCHEKKEDRSQNPTTAEAATLVGPVTLTVPRAHGPCSRFQLPGTRSNPKRTRQAPKATSHRASQNPPPDTTEPNEVLFVYQGGPLLADHTQQSGEPECRRCTALPLQAGHNKRPYRRCPAPRPKTQAFPVLCAAAHLCMK